MHRIIRIAAVATIAATAAAGAVLFVEAQVALNRDYEPVPDYEVRFTTDGCGPPLRMEVLGDSTVAGLGAPTERETLGGHVARKVADATGRAVRVRGRGVSGALTRDVLREQLPKLSSGAVDVIVIEIGSNDVTHLTRLGQLERDTRAMLERALELAPVVVLGSAGRLNSPNFLPPLRQVIMARSTAVRGVQLRVAGELGVPAVDVAEEVSPTYDRTGGARSDDDFHPSGIGYEIWARPLAARVVEALGDDQCGDGSRT